MINKIKRGQGKFEIDEHDLKNIYFEAVVEDKTYAYVHAQIAFSTVFLHLYVKQWSKSVLKEMKKDLTKLKKEFEMMGIVEIIGSYGKDDFSKWEKFLRLFITNPVKDYQMPDGKGCKYVKMEVANGG